MEDTNIKQNKVEEENYTIIDAASCILGRLGSNIAKRLLLGEKIKIVNCSKVVILGKRSFVIKRYQNKIKNRVIKKGPYYSRNPKDIVKRSFRNMLPYKNSRGKAALLNLKCYNSTPSTLLNKDKQIIDSAKLNQETFLYHTKIDDLCKVLGYTKLQENYK